MAGDVRYILDHCPEDRQVQMFTATITISEAEREKRLLKLMHCVSSVDWFPSPVFDRWGTSHVPIQFRSFVR